MAVLTEDMSIIVRIDSIERKFPSGMRAFVDRKGATKGFCADGELVRFGLREGLEVEMLMQDLLAWGFVHVDAEGKAVDIALIDQLQGPLQACDWLEWGRVTMGDAAVNACRLVGSKVDGVAVPVAWTFQHSASALHLLIEAADLPAAATRLRDVGGGLIAYQDPDFPDRKLYVRMQA